MRHGIIKVRTAAPDYSSIPVKMYDWEYTCYRDAHEEIPFDAPEPKGKSVTTTLFFDANLYHDLISGKAVSGILHMFNQTPVDWYSKLQTTAESATFGSEYISGRTCVEQIIDLGLTLRYLGVPINGPSMMFGDNESVINSAAIPHSKMHKRHVALSYHRVRWAVAASIVKIYLIAGKKNPADILSKHWDFPSVYNTIKPLLFSNVKSDAVSQKDSSSVKKAKPIDKLVPDEGIDAPVKSTGQS